MIKQFHFAWVAQATQTQKPICTTSPFLKQWRAHHRRTCGNHGECCHVFNGIYFTSTAPRGLFIDFECLGCGEHYREGA